MSAPGESARPAPWRPRAPLAAPGALEILRISTDAAGRLENAPREAGVVHSVFEEAVNILWHDERLLTLHGSGPLQAPFAAGLQRMPPAGVLRPAMPVSRLGRVIAAGSVTVSWRAATLVDTSLAPVLDPPTLLTRALLAVKAQPGAPALGSPRAREAQDRVGEGLRHHEARVFAEGARALIGLGEGLTPAGDDCLVGVLAVLARFRPSLLAADPGTVSELADCARAHTTIVGREFLLHALAGEFSEPVLGLMTADSEPAARGAAERLASMGASSGADTLNGMRLALADLPM